MANAFWHLLVIKKWMNEWMNVDRPMWNVSLAAEQGKQHGTEWHEAERWSVLSSTTTAQVQQVKTTATSNHWHHTRHTTIYMYPSLFAQTMHNSVINCQQCDMSRIGKAKAWHWQQSTIAYVYNLFRFVGPLYNCNVLTTFWCSFFPFLTVCSLCELNSYI